MHKHALNASLQSDCARVTSSASTAQLQENLTIHEASELDITTIFLDSWTDTGLK
jgi:hypothetical protein